MAVPQDARTIAHAKDKPMKQIDANRILNTMRMDGDRVGILQFSYELAPNLQCLGGSSSNDSNNDSECLECLDDCLDFLTAGAL